MLKDKIKNIGTLKRIVRRLKKRGKKIVFTNGCFDLLHYGHVKYLEDARGKGDILIVALNSDSSVKKIKGRRRPITKEKDRLGIIAGLESADYVVLFNEETPLKAIKELAPDVLVKGGDWGRDNIVGSDFVIRGGGRVCTIKFIKGYSTTGLIEKIAKKF